MIKKILLVLAITLTAFASSAQKPEVITVKSPGDTTVLFTVKTVTYSSVTWAPAHVLAIWITNSNDQHIRTLKVRAATYKAMLYKWKTYTGGVIPADAISGPSIPKTEGHQTHTVAWNGKDASGNVVPDGVYNLWVEFNETNFSGNPTMSIQFTKGGPDQHITPANTSYFQNIDLKYFALPASIESLIGNTSVTITPNPSTDEANIQMELKNNASVMVTIYSITGQMVHRFDKSTYTAGVHHFLWNPKSNNVASGTYFVHVNVDQKNQIFKLIIK